ncbi:MAG: hypothetical protein WAK93_11715, partial [Solirubrobacteraceae bacterium]
DTWLGLLAGRTIDVHGIPQQEFLTVYAHGRAWVDQQWLAQLLMYWEFRIGGLALTGLVNVALIVSGIVGAILAALALGATRRSVLRIVPLAAIAVAVTAEVRTQAVAYPLFVATFYLLCTDSRSPSSRVYWCLPLIALWGNLHGSVTLGAGLVALRGLERLWEARRDPRRWPAGLGLIIGAPLCLLVNPYGSSIESYYRATLFNTAFRRLVVEWQPVTSFPLLAVIFFVLAAIAAWSVGRRRGRATLWECCALLVLAVGAIIAVRNVVWFALGGLILIPVSLGVSPRSETVPTASSRRLLALNRMLAGVLAAVLLVLVVRTLTRSTGSLEPDYRPAVLTAVRTQLATSPGSRVFADVKFADWLMWELPASQGRLAFDARFELLSSSQLKAIYDADTVTGLSWERGLRGYPVVVLDTSSSDDLAHALREQPGTRVQLDTGGAEVLTRAAPG